MNTHTRYPTAGDREMTRTWKIRDQMPDGKWGPEREVTMAQYRAEIETAKQRATAIYQAAARKLATR